MVQTIFSIQIDDVPAKNQIVWLKEEIKITLEELKDLEKTALKTANKIIHYAQLSWGVLQGVVRATGGAISMTQRLIVSAVFGGIRTLTPIITAALHAGILHMNPAQIAQATLGLAQVFTALAALTEFESGSKERSLQLRGLNFMFSNMNMMLSGFSF